MNEIEFRRQVILLLDGETQVEQSKVLLRTLESDPELQNLRVEYTRVIESYLFITAHLESTEKKDRSKTPKAPTMDELLRSGKQGLIAAGDSDGLPPIPGPEQDEQEP